MNRSFPNWHPMHFVPPKSNAVIDIGCNVGESLVAARALGVKRLYGIDINRYAVDAARQRFAGDEDCALAHGSADELPFDANAADVAICTEVLEHLPSELRPSALREIHRVLRDDGTLIFTVPAAGMFAPLDPANLRFRFKSLYGFVSSRLGGPGRDRGYEGQKHGIVWHHHFTLDELHALFEPYFEITTVRWRASLLAPICDILTFPFARLNRYDHPVYRALVRVTNWDHSKDFGEAYAYNVLLVAKKRPTLSRPQPCGDSDAHEPTRTASDRRVA
ncbi:class I SAM-dependent methyltransferase [Pendulispora brunnea]|uniref:Class I SAM-dependent methyltransferase n=1 Tax=Pendulispora brunnea TaxID=2905690 RepID=A0ABZ2K5A8_9BACT